MWGWLAAIVKGLAEGFVSWRQAWSRDRYVASEREKSLRLEASEMARKKEREFREAVADVERRALPGGVAGPRVRDTDKPLGG